MRDHTLNVLHAIGLQAVHQLLLLVVRQAIAEGAAVHVPVLRHDLFAAHSHSCSYWRTECAGEWVCLVVWGEGKRVVVATGGSSAVDVLMLMLLMLLMLPLLEYLWLFL